MSLFTKLTVLFALCISLILTGCDSPTSEPEIQLLNPEETVELLTSAKSVEPFGKAVVNELTNDAGTTITTTQLFRFRMDDGAGGSVGTACTGICKVDGAGGTSGCRHSGCMPTKLGGCTPLKCSGSCSLSVACSLASASMAVFRW